MPKRAGYRPDIQALRGVAVLVVVLFHAGLGFSGGFVGVDVFFCERSLKSDIGDH